MRQKASSQNLFKSTDKMLILGRSGCGKSYLCRRLQKLWPRKVIIDSLAEYDDHDEIFTDFKSITDRLICASAENEKEFTFVFQFDPDHTNDEIVIDELLRFLFKFGNVLVVIEEVQNFSTTHSIPHWMKRLLMTGRHRNIGMIFTTQRPGLLNKNIASQCAHIFCGNLIDRNDVKYVSAILNSESEKLTNLKDRKFFWRSPNGIREISNDFSS